jgi:putative ABC transport system substrate-binding protein
MKRREFITLLSSVVAWPLAARAQQPGTVYRIGLLTTSSPSGAAVIDAFLQRLQELGYIEGRNLVIERRYPSEEKVDRLAELAAELVRLNVDVIVAMGSLTPHAAKQATSTVPIVITNHADPVGSGLVASLASPSGNVTGLSLLSTDLVGKQLEMLKEAIPD